MSNLRSNLVALVDAGDRVEDVKMLHEKLKAADIFVSDTVEYSAEFQAGLVAQLAASDSSIILSLLSRHQVYINQHPMNHLISIQSTSCS